jgi:hypothetical protein
MEKILFISPSTLDRKSLLLTLMVCVLPTLWFGWLFYRSFAVNHTSALIPGLPVIMCLAIFILGIVSTPYKYILTNTHLIVKRHLRDIVIPLQNIKNIRLMTKNDKKGLYRSFGAEGSFGLYGYYRSPLHGKLIVSAGDKIHLNVHRGISPIIKIIDRQGAVYYINRENEAETRQIFKQLRM